MPYFHLLNVFLLVQQIALAYSLAVGPADRPPVYYHTIPIMLLLSFALLGMRNVAVQLANPFGHDQVDFDIETFLQKSYDNAIAHLRHSRRDRAPAVFDLPPGMKNPLLSVEDERASRSHWGRNSTRGRKYVGKRRTRERARVEMAEPTAHEGNSTASEGEANMTYAL